MENSHRVMTSSEPQSSIDMHLSSSTFGHQGADYEAGISTAEDNNPLAPAGRHQQPDFGDLSRRSKPTLSTALPNPLMPHV
jgi:hypothetical protein